MKESEFLQNLIFVVDSREQTPYEFLGRRVEVSALPVGDYSIKGLEGEIAIERKGADLIQSICQDRDRFERELARSRALTYFALVCECTLADLANGSYRSRMNPKSAIQTLLTFSVRYGIPIFFVENRFYGNRIIESLLEKYAREYFRKFHLLVVKTKN